MKVAKLFVCAAVALCVSAANAAYDLQITEMWPGNEPGENLTSDWFEVTNFGDMPWVEGVDGELYFDDDSADPELADLISGVSVIFPGQSVVFIDDDNTQEFKDVWGARGHSIALGTYNGSGMSQSGDGATLFVSNGQPLADFSNVLAADLELYPDANAFGGQSYDSYLGEFSTVGNASGAVASQIANDMNQFGIASPGTVPEPTSIVLAGLAAAAFAARRR